MADRDRYQSPWRDIYSDYDEEPPRPAVSPGKIPATARLASHVTHIVLRAPAPGEVAVQGDSNAVAPGAASQVSKASGTSGQSLPDDLRRQFEGSLGTDLSGVRVHTGSESAEAAHAVGAKAYAVGQDVHFGAGQYDPTSESGQFLIAHEVAHTVQQAGAAPSRQDKLEVSSPQDAAEVEADQAATAMVAGTPATVSTTAGTTARAVLHRQRYGNTNVSSGSESSSKKATAAQVAQLKAIGKKLNGLAGQAQIANSELPKAFSTAKKQLDQIDDNEKTISAAYKVAYKSVNDKIKAADEKIKLEKEIALGVLTTAFTLLAPELGPAIANAAGLKETIEEAKGALKVALDAPQRTVNKVVDKAVDTAAEGVIKGPEAGGSEGGEGGVGEAPGLKELAAVQQISQLKSEVLAAASKVIDMGPLITAIRELNQEVALYAEKGTGTSASDPVETVIDKANRIVQHAPAAFSATNKAAGQATKSCSSVASSMAAAAKSETQAKMEERLWMSWIAGVSNDQKKAILDKLDDGALPANIKQMLGVDTGWYDSDSDLNAQIAHASDYRLAQGVIGKTGYYTGRVQPGTYSYGQATVDGMDFTAMLTGVESNQGGARDGVTLAVIVVDAHVFSSHAAPAGASHDQARKRFGVTVRPLVNKQNEADEDDGS